jgi:pimeloyl-ACP methyl ester carboxylesterase
MMTSLPIVSRPNTLPAVWIGVLVLASLSADAADQWSVPQDQEFRSEWDGSVQRYVELLPQPFDARQEHQLLIALHGHGSDRWQYIRQERGECAGARDTALNYGLIFLSPDYRAPDSWMGPAAEADLVQIIQEARRRHRIGKVILGGGSMGGTSVLIFAALHPDMVDGVVSQNGTANMLE